MQEEKLSTLDDLYQAMDKEQASGAQRPCIGISVNLKENLQCVAEAYIHSVTQAGGIPLLIPVLEDAGSLVALLERIDGLILTGGGDIHPSFFNEEICSSPESINLRRDIYDLKLIKLASDRQIPLFGICRGFQVINVAFGGSLYQDIPSQYPARFLEHNQEIPREEASHPVRIEAGSELYSVIRKEVLPVNSFHHQAIKDLAPVFRATATTEDGIIEAFESNRYQNIRGVQWHPEAMAIHGNEDMQKVFVHFVGEAFLFKRAKEVHQHIISIDSHCDTPLFFSQGINIGDRNSSITVEHEGTVFTEKIKVSLPKMKEGMLDAVFMIAYLKQGPRDAETTRQTVEKTKSILSELSKQIRQHMESAGLAVSAADIARLKQENKKAILMGIENAYGIGNDIRNIAMFKEMGVSYITLCHNGNNDVCDSASDQPEYNGLSTFGKEVVKEMNRLGIMVDISHTSEKTSFDAVELSDFPVIASHSSAKALCDHRRNLSDELIRAIAAKGGVVQVCLYESFLSKDHPASLKDAVDHIDYIVKLVGIEFVGVGSDMDGGGGIPGIDSANETINLTVELLRRNYSESDIRKIWSGNLMRVMTIVQQKQNGKN